MSIQLSTRVMHIKDQSTGSYDTVDIIKGRDAEVDDALSPTSENPVQNKVINSAISGLSDDLNHKVSDVKVNNVSIVDANNVAEIPIADNSRNLGLVKVGAPSNTGIGAISSGELYIQKADTSRIRDGINQYAPIVPYNQHEATFYGLGKAASDSSYSYTDAQKTAIQKLLGIYEAPWELIRADTFTLASQGNIEISVDDNGQPFELTDIYAEFMLPTQETDASVASYGRVRFYVGNSNVITLYMGAWTQNAGATAVKSASQLIEQRCGAVNISYTRNALYNDEPSIITLGINLINGSTSRLLFPSGKHVYTKIVYEAITGTAKISIHGKRKWQ